MTSRLEDELSADASRLQDVVRDVTPSLRRAFKRAVELEGAVVDAYDATSVALEQAMEIGEDLADAVRATTKRRPLRSLGVAFGIALAGAFLAARLNARRDD